MTEYDTLENAKEDWQTDMDALYTHEESDIVITVCEYPESPLRPDEEDKYRLIRYFRNNRDNWNVSVDESREDLSVVLKTYTQLLTGNGMIED